jgi:hypothetical protein
MDVERTGLATVVGSACFRIWFGPVDDLFSFVVGFFEAGEVGSKQFFVDGERGVGVEALAALDESSSEFCLWDSEEELSRSLDTPQIAAPRRRRVECRGGAPGRWQLSSWGRR